MNALIQFYEQLSQKDVARMGEFYVQDAAFKDPFNEVVGLTAIQTIFEHMFDVLESPRFVITDSILQDQRCFLSWDFSFQFKSALKGKSFTIRGGSHIVFAADGRVQSHRDYWDAAEELYEKLPVLGSLMRWLKNRAK